MAELHANDRLDKRQARRAFEQAAETYDAAAALQQEIGSRLLERMDMVRGRIIAHPDGFGFVVRDDGDVAHDARLWV